MNRFLLLSLLFLFSTSSFGQESENTTQDVPQARVSTTQQEVTIDGKKIDLTAHAGTMKLRDENNEAIALFGFTAYFKNGASSDRPIMFAYNGGPGSSSFWLHMGVLGPKRIVVNDPSFTPAAPYDLVNNEFSVLDVADLVMIDPVGTGLSVPVGKSEFKDFWGVDQDIRSISLFITQFLIEHDRLNSPKFLLGESYGTFRNAGVMNKLLSQGIAMNGVIMVSAVFDLRSLVFPPGDDLPYIAHFPTYATTSWYHDRVSDKRENLEAFVDDVRVFTRDVYAPALFKGDQLTRVEKESVAQKLSDFTGLSADFWFRADLRVTNSEYFQELLRDKGETVGRLDSRYTGIRTYSVRRQIMTLNHLRFHPPTSRDFCRIYTMNWVLRRI